MLKKTGKIIFLLVLVSAVFLYAANLHVIKYKEFSMSSIEHLPMERACLVLGTSKTLSGGMPNLFYKYRMEAAAKVFVAGKCKKIVVSGDNRRNNYNEPDEMRNSLISLGVPAVAILCDYAGGRTLDSVLRFKYIFGQETGIVISQEFHNERAIYIARKNGINLIGLNAQEVDAYNSLKTKVREIFSKGLAVIDVEVLHSGPRHYGEKIAL